MTFGDRCGKIWRMGFAIKRMNKDGDERKVIARGGIYCFISGVEISRKFGLKHSDFTVSVIIFFNFLRRAEPWSALRILGSSTVRRTYVQRPIYGSDLQNSSLILKRVGAYWIAPYKKMSALCVHGSVVVI